MPNFQVKQYCKECKIELTDHQVIVRDCCPNCGRLRDYDGLGVDKVVVDINLSKEEALKKDVFSNLELTVLKGESQWHKMTQAIMRFLLKLTGNQPSES